MRFFIFILCLPIATFAAASLETSTDTPQRENFADRSQQQLREIRRAVDAKAGTASQTDALQYQDIYAALARCDDLLAQFRRGPEHERAGSIDRFDQAKDELLRLQRELQDRGALPVSSPPAK